MHISSEVGRGRLDPIHVSIVSSGHTATVRFDSCAPIYGLSLPLIELFSLTSTGVLLLPKSAHTTFSKGVDDDTPAATEQRSGEPDNEPMNLHSLPNVDLFSAGINPSDGVLVAHNPSHDRGYARVGLFLSRWRSRN